MFLAAIARHYFIPYKLGYHVPKEQGRVLLPEGWVPKQVEDEVLEQVRRVWTVQAKLTI
jgi:hypothetical protein